MRPIFLAVGAMVATISIGLGIFLLVNTPNAEMPPENPYPPVYVGSLVIQDYWIAESLGAQQTSATYLTIASSAATDDRLTDVRAAFAGGATLHRTITEDGVSRMERLTAVIIPAGSQVTLAPGGLHLMLTGVSAPLTTGGEAELTLVFLEAGEITFRLPVRSRMEMMDHSGR